MSSFYLDVTKDRMYASRPDDKARRAGQTTMYIILDTLTRLLAPVLAFTAEEVWKYLPHKDGDITESVMLNDWPVVEARILQQGAGGKWDKLLEVRDIVLKALEEQETRSL